MAEANSEGVDEAPDDAPEFVDLFAGSVLGSAEAEAVTLRERTRVVVFAGAEDSGKTTVLTSIYERFNSGTFAGFRFAGSRSLLGFEEICHLNRLASGGSEPGTPRTGLTDDAEYFHLALRPVELGSPRRQVLLSAMSGELFRLARDSAEDAERLTYLRRADTIVVLIDGKRLATPALRTGAQTDAADILESLLDAKMFHRQCRIEFAFSKLDEVNAAGAVAADFMKKTEEKFEQRFRTRVPDLAFTRIAARPAPSNATEDTGLEEAFVSWMTPLTAPTVEPMEPPPPRQEREFSKFGWRHSALTRGT